MIRPLLLALAAASSLPAAPAILTPDALVRHVGKFNAMEDEPVANLVPNAQAAAWLQANVPLFECPDAELEEIYFFRWWALRKHLRRPPNRTEGHVFTEFINRAEPVSSALGHHLMDGRWLRDARYHDDYVRWWLRSNDGAPHARLHHYSQWLHYALWQRGLVTGDRAFLVGLLDELVADYRQWEKEKQLPSGLFWQFDVRDAMEESISGSRTKKNIRPTINSYMFGNAQAIAAIATWANQPEIAQEFTAKAATLRRLTQENLWHADARFFEVRHESGSLANVREQIGFIPWYFGLPEPGRGYETAWAQLKDEHGFRAPLGITTAERRHPQFRTHGVGGCEWDGAVWPFATSQTLVALANVLRDYPQKVVTPRDYFDALRAYARSQRWEGGKPYIGEYLDEKTGAWLKGNHPRSRWYNHSTFADLVITGLVGLRPRDDHTVEVHPLLPEGTWAWFCLDDIAYHGRTLTILWDRDGKRYGRGAGLRVLVEGKEIARSAKLERVTGNLQGRSLAAP
ncbi:MAG TPA: glycosyl hydrolase family 65 protein [Opitutaceae bacterium]|nr:glycosyl hydrolase family 65 protein [Opitutaceae bacterium]